MQVARKNGEIPLRMVPGEERTNQPHQKRLPEKQEDPWQLNFTHDINQVGSVERRICHGTYSGCREGLWSYVEHCLLVKLHKIVIRGNMFGWICSYLVRRKTPLISNGVRSRIFTCDNGTPQGGVLSPPLYTVMTSNVATHQFYLNIKFQKFYCYHWFYVKGLRIKFKEMKEKNSPNKAYNHK